MYLLGMLNGMLVNSCIDGNAGSRYDTGRPQVPGMWVQVELPVVSGVNRILLDSLRPPAVQERRKKSGQNQSCRPYPLGP